MVHYFVYVLISNFKQKVKGMKSIINLFLLSIVTLASFGCFSPEKVSTTITDTQITIDSDGNQTIAVKKGKTYDHPSFVIWMEDLNGNYIGTIYITESYASGIYSHEMVNDSLWLDREGPSFQPAALPYWTFKKGEIVGGGLVPTESAPFVDAYSGATPNSNFSIIHNVKNIASGYKILLEINQLGDWNSFWTNAKYPNNVAYKQSAQPSIVYAVEIDNNTKTFYLNPIGHGSPLGTDGKLYTNLNTLTTATEMIDEIKVSVK